MLIINTTATIPMAGGISQLSAEPSAAEQTMQVDAIHTCGARGRGDVVRVCDEQLLEVAALEMANPALADDAQRLRRVDRELVVDLVACDGVVLADECGFE